MLERRLGSYYGYGHNAAHPYCRTSGCDSYCHKSNTHRVDSLISSLRWTPYYKSHQSVARVKNKSHSSLPVVVALFSFHEAVQQVISDPDFIPSLEILVP